MREEEWRYRQQGEWGKSRMEHKKEPGEGEGGHTKGKGEGPTYRHPNHHCTSEEQVKKPAEGDRGRQAKPKKATGKRTTERTGEVCREGGRGEHRWKRGSRDARDGGGGGSMQPDIVEGEGVCNQT